MDRRPRYAVYFVPAADSRLFRFGSAALGYDCYTGNAVAHPEALRRDVADWHALTEEPRRYGFHATLKAPFHLSPWCSESQLTSALHSFAGLGHRVAAVSSVVRLLGRFAAIVTPEPDPSIRELAVRCTVMFDAFRAPMSPEERARRVAARLSPGQIQNLDRWGYPFVFDDFRFHMTLTGTIAARRRKDVVGALRDEFERVCGHEAIRIDRVALLKQEAPSAAFRVVGEAMLRSLG